jgi:hypothetical protein
MLSYGGSEHDIASRRFVIESKDGYLQATVEGEFSENVMHMALDGICRNIKPLGGFLVAQAFGYQRNNLTLP